VRWDGDAHPPAHTAPPPPPPPPTHAHTPPTPALDITRVSMALQSWLAAVGLSDHAGTLAARGIDSMEACKVRGDGLALVSVRRILLARIVCVFFC
jgi:hypothetical protein